MSTPKYRWWGYARKMVRDFPKLSTATSLSTDEQKEKEAVQNAIEQTRIFTNGAERLKLIQLTYWSHNRMILRGAAIKLYISEETAKAWHGDFIRLVGQCRGFSIDTTNKALEEQNEQT